MVSPSRQHTEPKQHSGDADEQLQHQEDHQSAQDTVDEQLARNNPQQINKEVPQQQQQNTAIHHNSTNDKSDD